MNALRVFKLLRCCLLLTPLVAGCQPQMSDQPKYRTLGPSDFFDDGRASRNRPAHTVAREDVSPEEGATLLSGKRGKEFAQEFPESIAKRDAKLLLARGQQRYAISCSPCHGLTGYGDGMVAQRGFKHPPSFHDEKLRTMPVGQIFETITNGFGVMPSYAAQVLPEDRWAIAAYIRALQLSQDYPADQLSPEQLKKLPTNEPDKTERP